MAKKKMTIENAMAELAEIVKALESGDEPLELEKAIKKFEEGIKLTRKINGMLDESEKIIQVLLENVNGEIEKKPFDSDSKEDITGS